MQDYAAIVIGGGVVGLCTAYHLARRDFGKIVLLEKGAVGDGSSRRAAGITSGLLWSETGVLARQKALQLFREFSGEFENYTFHDEQGCLNLISPEAWPAREELLPLYDRLGSPYQILDTARMQERWPALHPPSSCTGLWDPLGGYSEPDELVFALAKRVRQLGVEIRESQKVIGFRKRQGRLCGVKLVQEEIEAEVVVSTVHVWSPTLLKELGLRLPVKSFVHQRYLSRPLPRPIDIPAVNADPFGGYIRPAFGNRILLGVETPEREEFRVPSSAFTMSELGASGDLRDLAVKRFIPFCPALANVSWESESVGLISFSLDGEPILGGVNDVPGLYLGVSFHSGGFSYSPVAGLLLAELVATGKTSIDISAFSPNRFKAHEVNEYLASTFTQKDVARRRH